MEKFTRLTGVAAPLPMVNVDTDMVIPKNYLKTTVRTGLGRHLFAEMRYEEDGSERADFVLNKPAYRQSKILIAFENFGCGSSREHAPWALLDFGIRCVIAPSFADIFFNNCFKNGILPVVLPKAICEQLIADAERGANATLTVDLDAEELIRSDGERIAFAVEPFRRHRLLQGLDEIGATMARASSIDVFEDRLAAHQPWRASVLGQ
ncbi:MAG: 3-isopropylmalate dehydratase small subunit [Alphaproteobacteria bacterium]|jgi:3-isopropylmalate/(R)-2-methylmalate dehydratase small subunit|nr:3-isopropylmalate dehydratase small subunit [Alphaproteobacteria bacterium]